MGSTVGSQSACTIVRGLQCIVEQNVVIAIAAWGAGLAHDSAYGAEKSVQLY